MKYRKLPVVIDAFKWTGGPDQTEDPEWIIEEMKKGNARIVNSTLETGKIKMELITLEGKIYASEGDYIIKGINGEIYPCKADIFEKTYELVTE